jgi:hypothetical protein
VVSPTERPVSDNEHSQYKEIYARGGTGTRNPSKRAATDPRGHWDRLSMLIHSLKYWHRLRVDGVLKYDHEDVVGGGSDQLSARLQNLMCVIFDINRYIFHFALLCMPMLYILTTLRTSQCFD